MLPTNCTQLDCSILSQKPGTQAWLHLSYLDGRSESIELPAGKCTVGSSPSCRIRIATAQSRPLQCLVVNQPDSITAVRWAPGILLNGQEFSEATLRAGDVLTIDELRMELQIGTPMPVDSVEEDVEQLQEFVEHQIAEQLQEFQPAAITLGAQQVDASLPVRQRCRRLVSQLRQVRAESGLLKRQIDGQQTQLASLAADRDALAREFSELKKSIQSAEVRYSEDMDRLIAELTATQESGAAAEQLLAAANGRCDSLQSELDRLVQQLGDTQGALQESLSRNDELGQSLAEHERQAEQLRSDLTALQEARSATEAQLAGWADSQARLSEELLALQAERDQLAASAEGLRQQFEEQQKSITLLEIDAKSAAQERQRAQAEANELRATCRSAQERIDRLQSELASAQQEGVTHAELSSQLDAARHELADRETQLSTLEVRLQGLQTQLQQELTKRNQQIAQLSEEIGSWQERTVASTEHREQLSQSLLELQQRCNSLEQELASQQSAKEQAEQRIAEFSNHDQQQAQQLDALRAEREQLVGVNQDLTQQVEEQKKRIALLEIDVKSATNEWQQAKAEISRWQEAGQLTEGRLAELAQQLAEREQQLQTLEQDLQEARGTLESIGTTEAEQAIIQEQLAELESLRSEREQLVANCHAWSEYQEEQAQHSAELAKRLEEQEQRLQTLTQELESAREAIQESTGGLQVQVEAFQQLEQEADALRNERDQLAADCVAKAHWQDEQAQRITNLEQEVQAGIADLQLAQQEITRLQESCQSAEGRVADLEGQLSVSLAEGSAQAALQDQLAVSQQKCGDQSQQLASLETRLGELQAELEQWQAERTRLAQELENRQKQFEQNSLQLAETQEQLQHSEQQRTAMQQAQEATQATLQSMAAAAESQPVETTENLTPVSEAMWQSEPTSPFSDADIVPESTAEETAEPASEPFRPTSFIEQYSHLLEQEVDSQEPARTSLSRPFVPEPVQEIAHESDHDDALHDYMANLMRRVRGDSESVPSAQSAITEVESCPTEPEIIADTALSRPEKLSLEELKNASNKPALPTDMSAMRELANSSAKQALTKHRRRRRFEVAIGKLILSMMAAGTAGYMIYSAPGFNNSQFLGGCAVGVMSGFWGLSLVAVLLQMIRDGVDDESRVVVLRDSEVELPIGD